MPTQVARSGANLANGNFIPEVWSKKLQAKFYPATCLDMVTNHDHEGEIKGQGSKVYIRVRPTVIISDYVANQDLNYQDLADDKVELLIDKAKSYSFKVDDIDAMQSDIKILNETTQDAAEQMKVHVERNVFASVFADATTQAANTQITAATVLNWIVDQGVTLDELNIPSDGRYMIVPPWVCGMIKKSDLKDASISGDGTSILRNGRVGMIDRFTIYMSNNLSGSGAAVGTPTHCLAGTKHAITFASQFVKTETLRLQTTFGDAIRGLKVYGFKVEVPNALIDAEAYK